MRAIVQRVSEASVTVDGEEIAAIGAGLLVLLGVRKGDSEADAERLAGKVRKLRVFEDENGRMNLDVGQMNGEILCISQFTLYGDTRKGNRPAFTEAAPAQEAEPLYQLILERLAAKGGRFGAHMQVKLVNDGPVTLALEA